jgi:hypothetical protein
MANNSNYVLIAYIVYDTDLVGYVHNVECDSDWHEKSPIKTF